MKAAVCACLLAMIPSLSAEERPMFLPFDLTIGGHQAVMKEGNGLFAQIDQAVKADALLGIEETSAMLIINAFPCAADGTVKDTQPAAVIFAQNTKETKLDATMDKKPLAPGTYLANVVAHNKTARVVFHIGEANKKVDFSKVLDFLKKKAGAQ